MSGKNPDNPYASPDVPREDGAAPNHPTGRPRVDIATRNVVGLALTGLAWGGFAFAHVAFLKIFRDFKLDLPLITQMLENDWLVYGVPLVLLATFLAGICARSKKRSAAIGTLGLVGLALAMSYAVVALLLPMLKLITTRT